MMRQIEMEDQVERSQEPFFSEVDGEIVMLSMSNGRYYQVGPVGTAIWKLMGTPCSVRSICERLPHRFEVDETRCREDVLAFLQELLQDDLVLVHSHG